MEAIEADPSDPVPPRNLSAGYYELGVYTKCISTAKESIALLGENLSTENQAQVEKLKARIAKAEVHSFKTSAVDRKEARTKIFGRLPRYKPGMFTTIGYFMTIEYVTTIEYLTTIEYFTVGHDTVTSIFEADMFQTFAPEAKEISFFLGGVGDARTVLQTVTVIMESEKSKKSPERKYHFTVNDISKSALARNVVVWMLLDELMNLDGEDEREIVLNTVFFIYLSTMLPKYAFNMLEETISKAISALEKGESPLRWLFLHEKDVPSYLAALKYWLGEGEEVFTSSEVVDKVSMKMWSTDMRNAGTKYRNEKRLYIQSAVLFPSKRVLQLHDPDFLGMIEKYSNKPDQNAALFKKYVGEHWHSILRSWTRSGMRMWRESPCLMSGLIHLSRLITTSLMTKFRRNQ